MVEEQEKAVAAFSEALGAAGKWISQLDQVDWETLRQNQVEGARELALLGWFLSHSLSPLSYYGRCFTLIRQGRREECERLLENHYEELVLTLRVELARQFPERKSFLETAFRRHDEADYVSAIPLFLIQSDGIGKEIFGSSPVSKRSVASLEKWLSQNIRGKGWSLMEGFLRIIHLRLPITANTDELGVFLNPLNRHAVLHGSDLSYATKRNSLKAVAWLQYVASFVHLKALTHS